MAWPKWEQEHQVCPICGVNKPWPNEFTIAHIAGEFICVPCSEDRMARLSEGGEDRG